MFIRDRLYAAIIMKVDINDNERKPIEGTEQLVFVIKEENYERYTDIHSDRTYLLLKDLSLETGDYAIVSIEKTRLSLRSLLERINSKSNKLTKKPR